MRIERGNDNMKSLIVWSLRYKEKLEVIGVMLLRVGWNAEGSLNGLPKSLGSFTVLRD